MGAKIITEKDFWMCSSGAVPAQLQGTRESTKKVSGDIYITVQDKSTSSWIDFGCTKYMMLMALAAVAAVLLAVVIGVLTVATGGAALVLLCMAAATFGAVVGAVVGGLLCGQKVASKRVWSGNKSNFISQGIPTITGAHTMACPVGGVVQFAPNVKTWVDAFKIGALNYGTKLLEAAFTGAAIGLGASFVTGTLVLAVPTMGSIFTNVAIMGGMKALSGYSSYSNKDALGEIHNSDEGWKAASPEYEAAKRIYSGGMSSVQLSDVLLLGEDVLMPFFNVKAPAAKVIGPTETVVEPVEPTKPSEPTTEKPEETKTDKIDEDEAPAPAADTTPQLQPGEGGGGGDAYENPEPRLGERRISNDLYDELRQQTPTQRIRDMVNEGVQLPMQDPALPGLEINSRLEADHIVSMDKITKMEGFEQLTKEQQLEVLNNPDNFTGLSKSANASKGAKSFEDWTQHKSRGIDVDPGFRNQMMQRETQMGSQLQQQIDILNAENAASDN